MVHPDASNFDTAQQISAPQADRVDFLNNLAWSLLHSDPQQSEILAAQACDLASGEPPYRHGLAFSLLIRSIFEWDRSEYKAALRHAFKALDLFEAVGDQCKQAYTLNHIATIHYFLGNSSQALQLGFEAIQVVEECADRGLLASLLNDTGYMLLDLGDPQAALVQLMRSLEMHREVGSQHGEAQALDSIGKAYLLLGDIEQALSYAQQSLALDRAIDYKRAEAEALGHIGKIYTAAGDLDRALQHYGESLALSRERGYRQFEASVLLDMGRAYLDNRVVEQALDTLQQAQRVAEEIETHPVQAEIHAVLSDLYEQTGDLAASLAHYKQFHVLKESVIDELTSIRVHTLQATHEAETARQQAEIYRLKNVALQEEIEQREQLIAELDAFSHTVAHDLKNPLWVVTGLGEYILEYLIAGGDEAIIKLGREQLSMGYKMGRIIDELLTLAQIRRHAVVLKPIYMKPIVAEVKSRLARQIAGQNTELIEPEEWPPVLGHAPWVEEIWTNYVSNAIKYGGTPPRVELGATPEGEYVRFWVRDNGLGINAEDQQKLFTEFTRLTSISGDQGHGLGLSIVQRIVEKLGGEIGVESTPGEGSTFSFTLRAMGDSLEPADTPGTA